MAVNRRNARWLRSAIEQARFDRKHALVRTGVSLGTWRTAYFRAYYAGDPHSEDCKLAGKTYYGFDCVCFKSGLL